MVCPQCGAEVPDGSTFCPKCDTILDPSFLDREPGSSDMDGAAAFFKSLSGRGKTAFLASILSVIFPFFPWAVLPGEGSVSGLEIGSLLVVIMMLAFLVIFTIRELKGFRHGSFLDLHYLSVEGVLGGLSLLFCIYRLIHPADIGQDTHLLKSSGYDVKPSIQFGLPLTLASILTAAGAIFWPAKKV